MFSKRIFIPTLEVGEQESVSKFLFYSSRDYLLERTPVQGGFKEEFRENPVTSFLHFVFSVLHHLILFDQKVKGNHCVLCFATTGLVLRG